MPTINYIIRSKKIPAPVTLRFSSGREYDFFIPLKIVVTDKKKWSAETKIILDKLKVRIFEQFNNSYSNGQVIDKLWLQQTIKEFFNRPAKETKKGLKTHYIQFVDFCKWWMDEHSGSWRISKNRFLADVPNQKIQYDNFIAIFSAFANPKIWDIDNKLASEFVDYLEDKDYSHSTIKRHVGRLQFFLNRAKEFEIQTNLTQRVYVEKEEDFTDPYLNETEINKIFALDLNHDQEMDNIRDLFIIGLWTGLRISDFNNKLSLDNINENYIEIKTTKTKSWVTIPLHPHVKSVLKKRFGQLPVKVSDSDFNLKIKTICMLCEIDEVLRGRVYKKKEKRKVAGAYPKYKLITSHVCRRSFVSNLYGKIPNETLKVLGGWSSLQMMESYVKTTKKESADVLNKLWNN